MTARRTPFGPERARPSVLAGAALLASGGMANAVSPEECRRYVHTNAIEHSHRDLGQGLVSWGWSWTAEGVADDIHVADCTTGKGIVARARAERMTNDIPYDRRHAAQKKVALHTDEGARAFFTFERLAAALKDVRVPTRPVRLDETPCACAAFYPDAARDGPGSNQGRAPRRDQ